MPVRAGKWHGVLTVKYERPLDLTRPDAMPPIAAMIPGKNAERAAKLASMNYHLLPAGLFAIEIHSIRQTLEDIRRETDSDEEVASVA